MEKYIEVMSHIVALTDTLEEGIEYIKENIQASYFENTIIVLADSIEAFFVIEKSVQFFITLLHPNQIDFQTENLKSSLSQLVYYYETLQKMRANEYLITDIIPAFQSWKMELEKNLQPYILV